jgi:ribonucleoside-triphosphate reductase (thioredoxin)
MTEKLQLAINIKDSGIRFVLSENREKILREQKYDFGFSDSHFGEIVYRRTYSRIMENGQQEDWPDTVLRVINGIFTIRKWWFVMHNLPWDEESSQEKALEMAVSMLQMKWLPPGRGLWVMGTDYIYERGGMALYNCAFVEIRNLSKDIPWMMDALMCGCGVGFGITDKPQELVYNDEGPSFIYKIPDSREGWVKSVYYLIRSYLPDEDNVRIEFSYDEIRPYGKPITGFGGTASGPEPLRVLHQRVRMYCEEYIDGEINWTHLTANLANAVGVCVVAGNVRRSAEICLGSPTDESFVNLKNYEVYPKRNSIGWMSNNSTRLVTKNDFLRLTDIAERVRDNGEPGIYNAINVQKYARYGDESYGVDTATGINPCGEIPLESYEVCNLSEVFPSRCSSRKEFLSAVSHATFYSSTVSLYPTHSPDTNAVVARNRRIGVSLSGIAEWIDTWGIARCTRWLKDGYHLVREVNKEVNEAAGVVPSIRVTTVKPSGTISQLAGVPSGMHFPTFQYAIRRIIMDDGSPTAKILKDAGYPWEPSVEFLTEQEAGEREYFGRYEHYRPSSDMSPYKSSTSIVFECPIEQGQARPAQEVSAWEQFALLGMLQREWSDNSVSCTIYFDPESEGPQVSQMLTSFVPVIKSVSMLPHSTNGTYPQMPYQGISEEEYNERIQSLGSLDWSLLRGSDGNQQIEMYCAGDKCILTF